MRRALREPISRPVWQILLSWGLAVLVITGLLSLWVRSNQVQIERNQRQQDADMCAMTSVFLGGPEPVAGPAGDRSRVVRAALEAYRASRDCPPQ
jgi:hypothetical protein